MQPASIYNNRTAALATGRGLDGQTVARDMRTAGTGGNRRAAVQNRRLGRRRGRGLRGARVQARLGRRPKSSVARTFQPQTISRTDTSV